MKKLITAPAPDQILGVFNDFTLEVCMNDASRYIAFEIRYHAYREVGAIPENEEELMYEEMDFQANTRVFLVWFQGKPVATIRNCIFSDTYGWFPIESMQYFQKDFCSKLEANTPVLESGRFAVAPAFQGRQSFFACLLLFHAHGLNATAHQCKYIVSLVRANHLAFYKRFLAMEPISTQPCYVNWANTEASLLANRFEAGLETILKKGMPAYSQDDVDRYAIIAKLPQSDVYHIAA